MNSGYFSLILHAHLPYVRHKDAERIEERWLFEAISETYIPLLWNLEKQRKEKMFTISFSAPLLEMLADPLMQRRYLLYLEKVESLLKKENNHVKANEEKLLVDFYTKRFKQLKHTFLLWDQNLLKGFRHFNEVGKIECICSSATHAFFPYLLTKEAVRAQAIHGIQIFKKHFGYKPRGFWLPECAFSPGIDRILFEEGVRYTFVDEHALRLADPSLGERSRNPIYSPHGLILFPRNSELTNKVWSSIDGYPGDVEYREFYRDIAYEREWEYVKPFMHSKGFRIDTGLKYNRVTGKTEEKHFYNRKNALKKVKQHSEHFIAMIKSELEKHKDQCFPPYMVVTSFDAELFGHWWFEGPEWLTQVIETGSEKFSFVTPEQFIEHHYKDLKTVNVSFNTWGRNGYGEVWLNEKNSWLYRDLHQTETEIIHCVTKYKDKSIEVNRCLKQMAREWMLASSSDWSFMIDAETTSKYAVNRIKEHLSRFEKLKLLLLKEQLSDEMLTEFENEYPFLEEIQLEVFISKNDLICSKFQRHPQLKENKKTILMLAWEYPPLIVGGLSRHVYDLSRTLVNQGHEVHVITTAAKESRNYEVLEGVHVHRVQSLQPYADEFYHWVGSLNVAFSDYVVKLADVINFDIIHAHDWLVCVAAKSIKKELNIPLVATIHATEHGRNGGIYTQLQRDISHKEWELCYVANKVIVCSDYMKTEIKKVFQLPEEKIEMIPNGVDIEMVSGEGVNWKQKYGKETDIYVFSVGRIVKEKGFQTIIDATPLILAKYPNVKFIIAGKGPMLESYQLQIKKRKLEHSVHFIGFISDELRNQILNGCDICLFPSLYEPFGIVALEGMIASKPTVVSDTGGLGEIVTHQVTGLKIYPNDVQSLATQIITCIEDEDLSKRIAKNGKLLATTKYSWDSLTKETVAVYDDTCLSKKECIGG
ncbi:glycosyl transferase [Anaerobacillus arseniciselenatis]|uniref:Glycosyl transferase n=1 Tax=Anaerobacillus arseniciselenatis TaxID=85682 RepID=A0A1S2LUA8_9BACI|nr:1,4-alpha-glucan branching protein domain-containing protein [Anaerobacillus arseniciselenatis]OIJ16099.1 glycosyl transferase [Anaerobacillus arseniciselenatis]